MAICPGPPSPPAPSPSLEGENVLAVSMFFIMLAVAGGCFTMGHLQLAKERSASENFEEVEEDSAAWSEHLAKYKFKYILLTFFYAIPCATVFAFSVVYSIQAGRWYNTAAGQPYIPKEDDPYQYVYRSIPVVLDTHMYVAVAMLVLIFFQLLSIGMGWKKFHKRLGYVTAAFIFTGALLGTIALLICDVRPKRGAENIFFVTIGIGIMTFLVKGLLAIWRKKDGKHIRAGLHMQYMSICVCLVFSPGWNRIITVVFRKYNQIYNGIDQQCFVLAGFSTSGFLYTWSFLAGVGTLGFWWFVPRFTRAPFFKKGSLGFLYMMAMSCILASCVWQTVWNYDLFPNPQCNPEHIRNWQTFANASRVAGLFSPSIGYGVCAPADQSFVQGIPAIFSRYSEIVVP